MTADQNKRYIRWGFYLLFSSVAWTLMQVKLLEIFSSDLYKWISLLSLAALFFSTFFYLIVLGIMPRYTRFLMRSDLLTNAQIRALDIFPKIENEEE